MTVEAPDGASVGLVVVADDPQDEQKSDWTFMTYGRVPAVRVRVPAEVATSHSSVVRRRARPAMLPRARRAVLRRPHGLTPQRRSRSPVGRASAVLVIDWTPGTSQRLHMRGTSKYGVKPGMLIVDDDAYAVGRHGTSTLRVSSRCPMALERPHGDVPDLRDDVLGQVGQATPTKRDAVLVQYFASKS